MAQAEGSSLGKRVHQTEHKQRCNQLPCEDSGHCIGAFLVYWLPVIAQEFTLKTNYCFDPSKIIGMCLDKLFSFLYTIIPISYYSLSISNYLLLIFLTQGSEFNFLTYIH